VLLVSQHTPEHSDIQRGDRLIVVTATGEERAKIADSDVEGCRTHERRHDFAGVYVREPDAEPGDSIFWPIEDVRKDRRS
jgi:hypothetical protein